MKGIVISSYHMSEHSISHPISSHMASTFTAQLVVILYGNHPHYHYHSLSQPNKFLFLRTNRLQVHASRKPHHGHGVDTRIHWDNEDEGWVGGGTKHQQTKKPNNMLPVPDDFLTTSFLGSHYEFLGVSPDADSEEIKAAYRKLSKEYHPDTTSLPLKTASEKFMKLRDVYNVLSDEESRRFYDWTLAQEAASRHAEKMKMKLKLKFEDPRQQQLRNWESVPDMVDRLGGRNMKLSDQAVSAITIDLFIIIFSICCIIYVIFFKEPYYY